MKNTRMLTEGAVLVAIYIVMLLIGVYVPFLSILIQFFLVLPFLLFSAKYSMKGNFVFLTASLLLSFLVGSVVGLAFTFLFGTTGMMIGYCIKKGETKQMTLISSSIVLLFAMVFIMIGAAQFFNLNFVDKLNEIYGTSIVQYQDAMEMLGQTVPSNFEEKMWEAANLVITLLPVLLIGTSFFSVFIIISINFPIAKRLGVKVPKFGKFRDLVLPRSILWLYLIIMLLSLMVRIDNDSYLYMAIINAGFIIQALMIIQGLGFIFYFAHMKKWSLAIPIMTTVLTFVIPFFLSIVKLLGIIDLGFHLRNWLKEK